MKDTTVHMGPHGGAMSWEEFECPACGEVAYGPGLKAPKDWYRCPNCETATPIHRMPRRAVLNLLKSGSQRRPGWTFLGSVNSSSPTPSSLSTGTIRADVGDQLLVLCLMYEPGGPVAVPSSVVWGSETIAQTVAGTITIDEALFSTRWLTVTANRAAAVTADWATAPSNRLLVVGRFTPMSSIRFNALQEEGNSYPDRYGPNGGANGNGSDFFVFCHCEQGDVSGAAVAWGPGVTVHDRRGTSTLVSTIASVDSSPGAGFSVDTLSGQAVNHAGSESGFATFI